MTLADLKEEVGKLPVGEQLALREWLENQAVVKTARLAELRAAVQVGLDDINRGNFIEIRDDVGLEKFFEGVRLRGQKKLEQECRSVA